MFNYATTLEGVYPDVFLGLRLQECKEILSFGRKAAFLRNELLFCQGEPCDAVLVIESGQIKVTTATPERDEVILWILGPGDTIDPRVDLDCYACSAVAMEDSTALVWDSHRFATLRDKFPRIRENLGSTLSSRLCELQTRFCELANQTARQRLAKSLLRLVAQIGPDDSDSFTLRMTQEELGKLTGLGTFTISRLLSNWEASGVLTQGRASLLIRDVSSLELLTRAPQAPRVSMKASVGSRLQPGLQLV